MGDTVKQSTLKTGGNIRQVAKATGVSVATVSRVMNGSDRVSAATRERVMKASRDLGYLPNPAARALATNRSRIIGVIVPTLAHSIFATFLDELEKEFSKLRFSVVIAMSNGDRDEEYARAQDMLAMGAEALILSGADHAPELRDLLNRHNRPFVYTSIWREKSDVPTIGYDNRGLAEKAVRYLCNLGHRRIAVLHGPTETNDRTKLRLQGAEDAASGCGEPISIGYFEGSLDAKGGVESAQQALDGNFKPTALFCASDVLALGALFEAPRLGYRIPQDLSVIGFDDLAWSALTNPALTTVSLPTREMGTIVAQRIADRLDENTPIASSRLSAEIVERGSTQQFKL